MNWKKWMMVGVVGLFVAVNLFLIFKKDSEIKRTKYIEEWTAVREQNLVQSKNKSGVVTPLEVEHVYSEGSFEQFLVKEGEEVQVGTPLFEYSSKDIESAIEVYEAEIEKLESEWEAIDANIDQLEDLERSLRVTASSEEENQSSEAMASSVEAQIYEKELQLGQIEAEIEKYEQLISIGDENLNSLTVDSTISGIVKEISHSLQNPVVTVVSNESQVEGILEEKEALEMEEGMKVFVNFLDEKMEGTISEIAAYPSDEPKVDKNSQYRVRVQFNEQPETEILTGAHVEMKIITKEVPDALTLPVKALKDENAFVLLSNGTVEKREVQTGLQVKDVFEISSGVEKGELAVSEPGKIKNNTAFFTPVDLKKLEKKTFKNLGKKEIFRYLGRGVLSR